MAPLPSIKAPQYAIISNILLAPSIYSKKILAKVLI